MFSVEILGNSQVLQLAFSLRTIIDVCFYSHQFVMYCKAYHHDDFIHFVAGITMKTSCTKMAPLFSSFLCYKVLYVVLIHHFLPKWEDVAGQFDPLVFFCVWIRSCNI
ncbi:MAG: hypothetical protein CMJ52_08320 [Planctomycetaceae bacterium]|nr:hypothetical protein [Planctomycetaceae bacterium]